MRKYLVVLCLLALGGCNSASNNTTLAAVQAALKSACGFELLASTAAQTIASMLGLPGVKTAADIADAICAKVNKAPPAITVGGEMVVVVQGVPVQGHRVR